MYQGIMIERARGACAYRQEKGAFGWVSILGSWLRMGTASNGMDTATFQGYGWDGMGWDGLVESLVEAYVIRFCKASNQSIPGAPPF